MTKDEAIKAIMAIRPLVPSEVDGSLSCYYCNAWDADNESDKGHDPDCPWAILYRLAQDSPG